MTMTEAEELGLVDQDGPENVGQTPKATKPDHEWAIVEIMGHRRHAGLCWEVQRFGAAMVRIDCFGRGDTTARATLFYGGSSIFSYTPSTEEACRRITSWEDPQPSLLQIPSAYDEDGEGEDEEPAQ